MSAPPKACPYVAREYLQEGCMAWRQNDCRLILGRDGSSIFERQLIDSAPLMNRSLLDLIRIMEGSYKDCGKCEPDVWNYAQQIRAGFLNELIQSELAEAGIRADDKADNKCNAFSTVNVHNGVTMAGIHLPTKCPRCGNVAEAWTEDGVTVIIRCKMCGYEGRQPHPDLKNGAWRVGKQAD